MRIVLLLLAFLLSTAASAQEPRRYTETLDTDLGQVPVPLELYLTAPDDNLISARLAGNLGQVQRVLPALLSDVVVDECDQRIGLEMQSARAEGDDIRMEGRVQITLYHCNRRLSRDSRIQLVSNITDVDILFAAALVDNCLRAELKTVSLNPSGIIGGLLNLTGITASLEAAVRDEANTLLSDEQNCLEMPEALQPLSPTIRRAGFRDFGDGVIGFVIDATVDAKAQNLIELLNYLADEDLLSGGCDCDNGG